MSVRSITGHGRADGTVYRECAHRVSVELEIQDTTIRNLNSKIDSRACRHSHTHAQQLPHGQCVATLLTHVLIRNADDQS